MNIFSILYKKNQNNKIQYWKIWVEEKFNNSNTAGIIHIEYGELGTINPQHTQETILSGKNLGKKNATTAVQQAYLEAKSKWEKQKKRCYVENIMDATAGKIDKEMIKGGVNPMLAQNFDKHKNKIKFPCFAQPKLDGHRCIAVLKDKQCQLWTRTRKLITSMPHIEQDIVECFGDMDITLDGELYTHNHDFEYISSLVRQEEPDPNHTIVEYHIYDIVNQDNFENRLNTLQQLETECLTSKYLHIVDTKKLTHEDDVDDYLEICLEQGYEGIMLRNLNGAYENKRSSNLQKVKQFDDEEFEVIGIKEGKGKLAGHVGAFTCKQNDGAEFDVKMAGDTNKLKEYFENDKLWKHKMLTVQFQGRSTYGIPRFPVGLRFRDEI